MDTKLKANFALKTKYEKFYIGGKVQVTEDGTHIFTRCFDKVNIISIETGKTVKVIANDEEDEVDTFCVTPDNEHVVIACRSLQLKQWRWQGEEEPSITRKWKAIHTLPILSMAFDVTSTLLATGSGDATIKVWDTRKQYCTHNFKGHQGCVRTLAFHPDISRLLLFSAADMDYAVRVWDLQGSVCLAVLNDAHSQPVTAIRCLDNHVVMAARDCFVTCWNLPKDKPAEIKRTRTIPVDEIIEGMVILPPGEENEELGITDAKALHFMTAGHRGQLRVWNSQSGGCVFEQQNSHAKVLEDLTYNATTQSYTAVTNEHHIISYSKETLEMRKQLIGYNDEILDLKYLGSGDEAESHVAVVTNSEYVKVFARDSWDCQVLAGHADIVLCADVYSEGGLLVTSSKDNSIRLWCMEPQSKQVHCIAVGNGHTRDVPAVAFSRKAASFVVSGSTDLTIKLWALPEENDLSATVPLSSRFTERAHDKDINSIAVAPNDKLIATGSMDRTAKLWSAADLSPLGTLRGHKRGVWSVQFSPVDQCVATSSADATLRVWSVLDQTCLKTFSGHDASVLRVAFISRGMQLLSSGSDGLLKLWNLKNNECVKTIDAHDAKVWALAVTQDEDIVMTGGADSVINVWKDVTVEEIMEKFEKQKEQLLKEQELSNLLLRKKYVKAIGLAITLDQPFRVLGIIKEILKEETGKEEMQKTIDALRDDQIDSILRYCIAWNTNARHCHAAHAVLSTVLRSWPPARLMELPGLRASLEGLLPYTHRHLARLQRLWGAAHFVTYTWQTMNPLARALENMDTEFMLAPLGSAQAEEPQKQEDVVDSSDDDEDGDVVNGAASKAQLLGQRNSKKRPAEEDSESEESEEEEVEEQPAKKKRVIERKQVSESEESQEEDSEEEKQPAKKKRIVSPKKSPKKKGIVQKKIEESEEEEEEEEETQPAKKKRMVSPKKSPEKKRIVQKKIVSER